MVLSSYEKRICAMIGSFSKTVLHNYLKDWLRVGKDRNRRGWM